MKKWIFVLVVIITALAVYRFTNSSISVSNSTLDSSQSGFALSDMRQHSDKPEAQVSQKLRSSGDVNSFDAEMIAKLKSTYGERIAELNIQASLIKVKQFIDEQFPADGQAVFERIIRAAFPDFAESILSIISRLEIYQTWLAEQYRELEELSPLAKNGALWEKRRELFAADADIIWADELDQLAQRKIKIQDLIHRLDQSYDMSMEEKLYQLQTAIDENLADSLQELAISGGALSQAFFNFDSVQQELKSLTAEERQEAINKARRQLGVPEAQIETMAAKDEERNKRWDNGLSYMAARNELVRNTDESALADALDALRQEYFKHEASTIQKEEEMDFWRYKRDRKFGNN
jgi:hypothetical protein